MTYNSKLHPKLVLWIARWGSADAEIAAELEITTDELAKWCKDHPEILAAILEGRDYWNTLAENSLQKLIKGYTFDETETTIEDVITDEESRRPMKRRVRKITKHVPPNAQAVLFQIENEPIFALMKKSVSHIPKSVMKQVAKTK